MPVVGTSRCLNCLVNKNINGRSSCRERRNSTKSSTEVFNEFLYKHTVNSLVDNWNVPRFTTLFTICNKVTVRTGDRSVAIYCFIGERLLCHFNFGLHVCMNIFVCSNKCVRLQLMVKRKSFAIWTRNQSNMCSTFLRSLSVNKSIKVAISNFACNVWVRNDIVGRQCRLDISVVRGLLAMFSKHATSRTQTISEFLFFLPRMNPNKYRKRF